MGATNSLTAEYLTGRRVISIPKKRRSSNNKLTVSGARQYNLKNVTVDIPLHSFVCISGVSGSGKSTLIREIVYPAVRRHLGEGDSESADFTGISGDLKVLKAVEFVDQNPIGKSSRSNPITYIKAFDDIRELYARLPLSKTRGYKAGFFSFNVEGGRCEMCEGEGEITVGMQFMADVHLPCETCLGKRYKQETLEIIYHDLTISDLLELDIQAAYELFAKGTDKLEQKIAEKIKPLIDVGLGYLKVGQSSSTLSGGEAQRIKLASFLSKGGNVTPTLFIFDEPTTGLHFEDVRKLLLVLNGLVEKGNTVIVIEHNLDVIKSSDWIIDLGPEGGAGGGEILSTGTPEQVSNDPKSFTGKFLKESLR
jgi:excinuclease ABC subunit A